jgi:hypothetical protein
MDTIGQYLKQIQEAGITSGWRTQVKRTELDYDRMKKVKVSKKRIPHKDEVSTMSDVISASNPSVNV